MAVKIATWHLSFIVGNLINAFSMRKMYGGKEKKKEKKNVLKDISTESPGLLV